MDGYSITVYLMGYPLLASIVWYNIISLYHIENYNYILYTVHAVFTEKCISMHDIYTSSNSILYMYMQYVHFVA